MDTSILIFNIHDSKETTRPLKSLTGGSQHLVQLVLLKMKKLGLRVVVTHSGLLYSFVYVQADRETPIYMTQRGPVSILRALHSVFVIIYIAFTFQSLEIINR